MLKPSQDGFSLVETLAAMGILAVAAIPLMQVSADSLRNARALESRLLARTVAENLLARTAAQAEPARIGLQKGSEEQLGRAFNWSLQASGTDMPGLVRIEVKVMAKDEEQVLAHLTSLIADD